MRDDNITNCTNCGNVTINGGTVNATGGTNSTGIGGASGMGVQGGKGGNITVNMGTVNAQGGGNSGGAGIGGAYGNSGGTLTVNGGTVIINGGNVTANGGSDAAGIGGGKDANSGGTAQLGWTNTSDSIYASSYTGTVTFISGFLLDGTDTTATADNIGGKKIVPNTTMFNITTAEEITSDLAYASAGASVTLSGKQEGYCYVLVYGGTFTMPGAHVYVDIEPITYSITYDLDGGMVVGNPASYTVRVLTLR